MNRIRQLAPTCTPISHATPRTHPSPPPKRDVDWFSRFGKAHARSQQTALHVIVYNSNSRHRMVYTTMRHQRHHHHTTSSSSSPPPPAAAAAAFRSTVKLQQTVIKSNCLQVPGLSIKKSSRRGRRYDMTVRLAADLRPSADGSAVRTWLSCRQPACR